MTEKNKGLILVVSAPSGAGKSSILKEFLKVHNGFRFSVSVTTRKKRPGEVEGKDYHFIREDEFKRKIEDKEFLEWENFFGNYYGTLKTDVESIINAGEDILLEVDVNGALNVKKIFPEAVLVFILPPHVSELENRLRKRKTEDEETIKTRIARAEKELSAAPHFDYKIVNDELHRATHELIEIINKIKTEN
ncbi:MAG: guanylate kinase [Ignavibacteriaceae bacterium]|nr:guanylate kinase [Ignavibacteriaceae bacterium]